MSWDWRRQAADAPSSPHAANWPCIPIASLFGTTFRFTIFLWIPFVKFICVSQYRPTAADAEETHSSRECLENNSLHIFRYNLTYAQTCSTNLLVWCKWPISTLLSFRSTLLSLESINLTIIRQSTKMCNVYASGSRTKRTKINDSNEPADPL